MLFILHTNACQWINKPMKRDFCNRKRWQELEIYNKLLEQDMSRNAGNRHWGSFMFDAGFLSNNMKFPSPEYLMTFCDLTIYNNNPLLSVPNSTFTEFWEDSIEHLQLVWHADRRPSFLCIPGLVPFRLAYVLLVETNPFSELVVIFPDYALRISLGTFSILLWMHEFYHE